MHRQRAEPGRRTVAVVLHDVAPSTWPMCQQLLDLVRELGTTIPVTLLVVPEMHRRGLVEPSTAFRQAIDALLARGCEVALHGLWHLDDGGPSHSFTAFLARRFLTAGEAEFASLSTAEAQRRIEIGLAAFDRCGWHPAGFVPPAWQIGSQAFAALATFRFLYTSSLGTLVHLPSEQRLHVPSLVFSARSSWRRAASVMWARWRLAQLARVPSIRLALHPLDAAYEETLAAWRTLLETTLRDREPLTKSDLCRALVNGPTV